jgi:diguanylate cyclase (GGDEF)-like protein
VTHDPLALHGAWSLLLQAMGQAAWIVDAPTLRVCAANAEAARLLGQSAGQLVGADATALISTPEDLAYWDDIRAGHLGALDSETVLVDATGRLVPVSRRISLLGEPGASSHLLVSVADRTEVVRQQEASETLVAELQATLESTGDGILVTDLAGRIRGFNRRFAQIWGMPEDLLLAHQDDAVYDWMRRSVVDPDAYQRRVDSILDATLTQATERIVLHSGQELERVTQPQSSRGRPCGRVWAFRDLTELVKAGRRIETLSTTDRLTGLLNRHQIGERLADSIRQARRANSTLALLILDLDRFKQINDSLGHEVGDRVLLDASERLKTCLRQGDMVARVGGDQFALLVHGVDHRGAEASARRVLSAISHPCSMDGLQFTLTCSVGVALFPSDAADADQLVRHAETAMQRAKIGGRACYRFHQQRHNADLRQRMRIDHAMRQALASQRFRLKYQPQIELRTGAVVGAEALIRWRDPELGEVSPAEFIPVAEDTGFIIAIGDWVLSQAVRQAATWLLTGMAMPVSINVSALQFQQQDFVDRIAAVLREHGLPGHLLELELTETILVVDADEALDRLSKLAQLGVQLAIDDFGTGYSSLSYLKRFPIERLKIDRSFVQGVPLDDSDSGIVRAIIQMSRALGLRVIAEGVETEAQRAFLQEAGCDQFQGFLYAPALDPLSFEERVRGQPSSSRPRLKLVSRS